MTNLWKVSAFPLILCGIAANGAAANIVDMGAMTNAAAVNNNGVAVGYSFGGGTTVPFVYENGSVVPLLVSAGTRFNGLAISTSGIVVGSGVPTGATYAQPMEYNGSATPLGTLPGGVSGAAFGINIHDDVVGYSSTATSNQHAFKYDAALQQMQDLGTLGGDLSWAMGINASGQVVGSAVDASGTQLAFLYDGTMQSLGSLGPGFSEAAAINDSGVVVGDYYTGSAIHAFRWDGTMHDLGTLGDDSVATSINSAGQIAGFYHGGGSARAFLYANGAMIDLNTLLPANSGWDLEEAYGINDSGLVVGIGGKDGTIHGFLLDASGAAAPEPGTWALLLAGLAVGCRNLRPARGVGRRVED